MKFFIFIFFSIFLFAHSVPATQECKEKILDRIFQDPKNYYNTIDSSKWITTLQTMKNLLVFTCILALLCACHHTKRLSGQNYKTVPADLLARNFNLPKFEIERIDSLEHTYIVYAKSDSGRWYQVVTARNASQICRNITVGTRCDIMFRSIFRGSLDHKLDGGYLHISSINYNGDAVPIDASCGYDVFAADNIEGLCLKFE